MRYIIYQIKDIEKCLYSFMEWEYAKTKFKYEDYERVYDGIIEDEIIRTANDDNAILESLFEKFNINHPNDFKGHSLSVSDIVELYEDDLVMYYYCDSFGWNNITDDIHK